MAEPDHGADMAMAIAPVQECLTILQAANAGNITLLNLALSSGTNLAAIGDDGSTALHCAAREGHTDILKRLLELGASPDLRNRQGRTSLHEAILGQNVEAITLLLGASANTKARDRRGKSVVEYALESPSTVLTELLVDRFGEEYVDDKGYCVFLIAAKVGNIRMVRRRLETLRINVNATSIMGYSALHLAAKYGHTEVVRQLLSVNGIKINTYVRGRCPLGAAAAGGHDGPVRLLASRSDLRRYSGWPMDPIVLALRNSHVSVARYLFEHNGSEQNRKFLNSSANRTDALSLAIRHQCAILTQSLLKDDTAREGWSNSGSPLWNAAKVGDTKVVETLLQSETADVNDFHRGKTALHLAASRGHVKIADCILRHEKTNLNQQDMDGNTPLHFALLNDHVEVAKLLLSLKHIKVNGGDRAYKWYGKQKADESVLDIAIRKGQSEIIEILISRGAIRKQQLTPTVSVNNSQHTEQGDHTPTSHPLHAHGSLPTTINIADSEFSDHETPDASEGEDADSYEEEMGSQQSNIAGLADSTLEPVLWVDSVGIVDPFL